MTTPPYTHLILCDVSNVHIENTVEGGRSWMRLHLSMNDSSTTISIRLAEGFQVSNVPQTLDNEPVLESLPDADPLTP